MRSGHDGCAPQPCAPRVEDDDDRLVAGRPGRRRGALNELLTKYRGFARAKARSYFLVGADHEDIVQEGMIGLYKAVRDFNPTWPRASGPSPSSASPARSSPRSRPRPGRSTAR